jgi:hypothetical protein
MVVVWIVGFLGMYNIIGFPEGILDTARTVMESSAK